MAPIAKRLGKTITGMTIHSVVAEQGVPDLVHVNLVSPTGKKVDLTIVRREQGGTSNVGQTPDWYAEK